MAKGILCFGDSITWGSGEYPYLGWTGRMKQDLEASGEYKIYNLGISGDTSAQLLTRIQIEVESRLKFNKPNEYLIVLSIGINDTKYNDRECTDARYTAEQFTQNIRNILSYCQSVRAKTVVLGLLPVDESVTCNRKKSFFTQSTVLQFNNILREQTSDLDLPFLDVMSLTLKEDWKSMFTDGLHPNSDGYDWLYAQIKPFVTQFI